MSNHCIIPGFSDCLVLKKVLCTHGEGGEERVEDSVNAVYLLPENHSESSMFIILILHFLCPTLAM